MKPSLSSEQQKAVAYLVGAVLLLALAGLMMWDLSRKHAEAADLREEVDRKELEMMSIDLPDALERAEWARTDSAFESILLSDQSVPQFLQEVTGLANQYQLQRIGIQTEDKSLDAQQPGSESSDVIALGIRRYLLVTLTFQSDYTNAARFVSALSQLPRPVEVGSVEMRRNPPGVAATVALKVYRREGT